MNDEFFNPHPPHGAGALGVLVGLLLGVILGWLLGAIVGDRLGALAGIVLGGTSGMAFGAYVSTCADVSWSALRSAAVDRAVTALPAKLAAKFLAKVERVRTALVGQRRPEDANVSAIAAGLFAVACSLLLPTHVRDECGDEPYQHFVAEWQEWRGGRSSRWCWLVTEIVALVWAAGVERLRHGLATLLHSVIRAPQE